jgi:hypothetical protein
LADTSDRPLSVRDRQHVEFDEPVAFALVIVGDAGAHREQIANSCSVKFSIVLPA